MAEVGRAQATSPWVGGSGESIVRPSWQLSLDGQPSFASGTLSLSFQQTAPCKTLRAFLMARPASGGVVEASVW